MSNDIGNNADSHQTCKDSGSTIAAAIDPRVSAGQRGMASNMGPKLGGPSLKQPTLSGNAKDQY